MEILKGLKMKYGVSFSEQKDNVSRKIGIHSII